ncbi:MAG: dynamin family protein [Isosphaeraceae bacterium]
MEHLERVRALLRKHRLDPEAHSQIHARLDRLEEREREGRLFLGVVGEFSSGKSTLLNALLRENLLRTDILQGTTAAATLLCYGPELAVTIVQTPSNPLLDLARKVGVSVRSAYQALFPATPPDREALRRSIHDWASVEEEARKVAQVNVNHPAACLRQGMVIIDLPGTNAENPRHGGVTAAALADFCDAAVVVVPADIPGSETLWDFLKNHTTPEVLRRCVFVLNKIDKIRRPRDREALTANLKSRLREALGVEHPRVVPAAPERVLEALGLLAPPDDPALALTAAEKASWVSAFVEAEALLWSTLHEQKLLLQAEMLARLLAEILGLLTAVLERRDATYRERHAALQRGLGQIPDLDAFVREAQAAHLRAYAAAVGPGTDECLRRLRRIKEDAAREIQRLVLAAPGKAKLREAIDGPVKAVVDSGRREAQEALARTVRGLERAAEAEHRLFHARFQELYRNLATLGGRVRASTGGLDSRPAGVFAAAAGGTVKELSGELASIQSADMWKGAGGAGVGAFLGTIALPGLGTVVGTVIGGALGSLFGRPYPEIQKECLEKLDAAVQAGFDDLFAQARVNLPVAADEIGGALGAAVGRYASDYRRLVREMIARDEAEAADLAAFSNDIRRDLADLRARQGRLDEARSHLRTL